jgi:hypothetical protein
MHFYRHTKADQLCQIREGFENCPRNLFLAFRALLISIFLTIVVL